MSALDYLPDDLGANDDYGDDEVTCNRCGADNLEWVHTGVRWRLMESNGKWHNCGVAGADEFEVIK